MIFYYLRHIVIALVTLIIVLSQAVAAEDTIKVLMHGSPNDPLPSPDASKIDSLNGELFINGQFYYGSIEVLKDNNGLYVINNLPFEEYVEGVVSAEIGREWENEALKAQAVISRTYAAFYRSNNSSNSFHITSSTLHQLYKGKNEDPLITDAVKATAGEILTYQNMPIRSFFHSTCGGKTEYPEEVWKESFPYLTSVDCYGRNTPYDNWQKTFSLKSVASALGTGTIKEISISSYTATGRAKTLTITWKGTSGDAITEIKATELRRLLGYRELPSTHFSLARTGPNVVFTGKGYGHGVGLSQWGALEMARQGKNYRDILSHYYPGTTLKNSGQLSYRDMAFKITP
ncbi:MAG: SpoIID/LytB domain-containing protein [Nitrospiraceae bacterium]|nr:MAG: SpoIID/LytB domain-containing protein [Nitrospiraceae bacterium]